MAREPASCFHHPEEMLFKSTPATAPGSDLFPVTGYYGNSAAGRAFAPGVSQGSADPSSPIPLGSVAGLKHNAALAVEWSIDEQYKLEEGLATHANEPSIMCYIKIAALLRDKTVRDVALRCKWMAKRKKQEDLNYGKKLSDRKEHLVESSFKGNISSASSMNAFSKTSSRNDQSDFTLSAIYCAARHLLEENSQAFAQISANLSSVKLQQNIELFFRTKHNLSRIFNYLRNMPGIMSRMPPLPVVLNEELANSIFPSLSQPRICNSPMVTSMKQEPEC